MSEISLDHFSDWINKCMAMLGLSVNPRVGPNIVWQGNNMYMYVVVRLIWSLHMYRSCHALLEAAVNYWASRSTRRMSICTWTHRVARLRGWKPNSSWTRIRQCLGFLIGPPTRSWLEDAYIREGVGAAKKTHAIRQPPLLTHARAFLLLVDLAVWRRNTSSPHVWDTSKVLHLEHKDEPWERDWHGGWPHNCTALLLRTRLHRAASAAPARLVLIPCERSLFGFGNWVTT